MKRRADILLLADEGPDGPGVRLAKIAERIGIGRTAVSQTVERAALIGAVRTAIGGHSMQMETAARRLQSERLRRFTDEEEQAIANAHEDGQSMAQLARQFDTVPSTIFRAIERHEARHGRSR